MATVYIETTIVSYLTAWPSRDLVRAAHQQVTREWWENERHRHGLFTSQLVLVEAPAGDPTAAAERLGVLQEIPLLPESPEARRLAEALLGEAALPAVAARDAVHVAVAATAGMDYLLTWNCRHLANASLRDRISEVCRAAGQRPPTICTPEDLLEIAMKDDPVVEEARKAGQAYIESFHGDLKAVFADLQRRTEEARRAGRQVVSLPLRQVTTQAQRPK